MSRHRNDDRTKKQRATQHLSYLISIFCCLNLSKKQGKFSIARVTGHMEYDVMFLLKEFIPSVDGCRRAVWVPLYSSNNCDCCMSSITVQVYQTDQLLPMTAPPELTTQYHTNDQNDARVANEWNVFWEYFFFKNDLPHYNYCQNLKTKHSHECRHENKGMV